MKTIIFLFLVFANSACSVNTNILVDRSNPIPTEKLPLSACAIWNFKVPGQISHVSLAKTGEKILVSSSAERGANARIRLLNSKKSVLWSRSLSVPVKNQAISEDGRLIAVSTYSDKLQVYSDKGALLWETRHLGRPAFVKDRIVLINDDDSQPGHSHFVYDLRGKLLFDGLISDLLKNADFPHDLEMSDASIGKHTGRIFLMFTKGYVLAVNVNGTLERKWRLSESASAVVEDSEGGVFVATANKMLRLNATDDDWALRSPSHIDALGVVGANVIAYSNAPNEQWIAAFDKQTSKADWVYSQTEPAPVTLPFWSDQKSALVLFDLHSEGKVQLAGINEKGKALWAREIAAPNGIYSMSVAPPHFIVGHGAPRNGLLTFFKIQETCPR